MITGAVGLAPSDEHFRPTSGWVRFCGQAPALSPRATAECSSPRLTSQLVRFGLATLRLATATGLTAPDQPKHSARPAPNDTRSCPPPSGLAPKDFVRRQAGSPHQRPADQPACRARPVASERFDLRIPVGRHVVGHVPPELSVPMLVEPGDHQQPGHRDGQDSGRSELGDCRFAAGAACSRRLLHPREARCRSSGSQRGGRVSRRPMRLAIRTAAV